MIRHPSGQATVEYAWVVAVLLGSVTLLGWPYLAQMLDGYGTYVDGIYFMLDGALP